MEYLTQGTLTLGGVNMWLQSAREHRFHAFLESPLPGVVPRLLFSLLVRWEIRVHWVEVRTQCLVKAGGCPDSLHWHVGVDQRKWKGTLP